MPQRLLLINHLQQEETVSCLAACAQMVLLHLGIVVQQSQLSRLFDQIEIGAVFSHIQRIDRYGLRVILRSGDENDLRDAIDQGTPPVIFVYTRELTTYWQDDVQHAIVVIGYDDTHFYLNDPAFPDAPKRVAIDEVMLAWLEFDYKYAVVTR